MKIQVPLPSQMFTGINHFYICHFLLNIFDLSVIIYQRKRLHPGERVAVTAAGGEGPAV